MIERMEQVAYGRWWDLSTIPSDKLLIELKRRERQETVREAWRYHKQVSKGISQREEDELVYQRDVAKSLRGKR